MNKNLLNNPFINVFIKEEIQMRREFLYDKKT